MTQSVFKTADNSRLNGKSVFAKDSISPSQLFQLPEYGMLSVCVREKQKVKQFKTFRFVNGRKGKEHIVLP